MSDDAKKKPGLNPERLVSEGDPGEALGRFLRKKADEVRSGRRIEFHDGQPEVYPLPAGRYKAVIAVPGGATITVEMHFAQDGYWHIQPGGAIEPERNIRRVHWRGELPE